MLTPDHINVVLGVLSRLESSKVLTILPDEPGASGRLGASDPTCLANRTCDPDQPCLADQTCHPDSFLIGIRDLPADPRCAGAGLFGLDLPDECELAAVSFTGSCSEPLDAPDVRVDALVTATGEIHSQVHHPDGPAPVSGRAGGVVVDALHRTLGLPAPGSPPPLVDLVTGMWFHQVMRLIDRGCDLGWANIAAAHLRPDGGVGRARGLQPPASEEVVAASIRRLADDASWDRLRTAVVIGRLAAPELDAEEAEWMDATMFGRWMADSFPSFDTLSHRLTDVGAADAVQRIGSVMSRLNAT